MYLNLSDLWEKGVWLSQCHRAFVTKQQADEWQRLDGMSASDAFSKGIEKVKNSDGSFADKFLVAFSGPQEIINARNRHRNLIETSVLRWLKSGQLKAIGFEPPRKLKSPEVLLPDNVWSGQVRWNDNTVSYQSLSFVDVRIIHGNKLESETKATVSQMPTIQPARPGRPGVKAQLTHCFDSLQAEGVFKANTSFASYFQIVRDWLSINYPNLEPSPEGLSEKTIRKHLSSKFKSLQAELNKGYKL